MEHVSFNDLPGDLIITALLELHVADKISCFNLFAFSRLMARLYSDTSLVTTTLRSLCVE
jgi:hypothetical protein